MSAIFELFRDDAGRYRFQFRTAAGEVIVSSDAYPTRLSVDDAIESLRRNAATAFVDDQTQLAPTAAESVDGA